MDEEVGGGGTAMRDSPPRQPLLPHLQPPHCPTDLSPLGPTSTPVAPHAAGGGGGGRQPRRWDARPVTVDWGCCGAGAPGAGSPRPCPLRLPRLTPPPSHPPSSRPPSRGRHPQVTPVPPTFSERRPLPPVWWLVYALCCFWNIAETLEHRDVRFQRVCRLKSSLFKEIKRKWIQEVSKKKTKNDDWEASSLALQAELKKYSYDRILVSYDAI